MQQFITELEASLQGCPKGTLKPETRFRQQPWWDSLAALMFMVSFENVYGIQLKPAELQQCNTIEDVAMLASKHKT